MSDAVKEKPPPQIAGVSGIGSPPVMTRDPRDDLMMYRFVLSDHPPFQMFVAETWPQPDIRNAKEHALRFMDVESDTLKVFEIYCAWFVKKGCWPNESALPWS